jgi:RimJ/RimL family protein N-acetyltransferase
MDAVAPFRIETERLVLRCLKPADAPLDRDAIDSSLEHLRPFMAFAWEAPEPIEVLAERLGEHAQRFASGVDFIFGIFGPDEAEMYGCCGLHPRIGPGALEIGYWLRVSRIGRGFATEAAAALTRVAFEHCGIDRVEIRADPANVASLAVPAKLGFAPDGTLRRRLPPIGPGAERRDARVFSLFADEYPSTPAAFASLEAFDAAGAPIEIAGGSASPARSR